MKGKAVQKQEFAVNILLEYAKENGINGRDTTDLSPLESWLILRLYNIAGQCKQIKMTQERFFELVYAWNERDLTGDELYKRVFALSDVSHSCEWCGAKKENHNGLCTECGRFPSPSNFRSHLIK